MIERRRLLQLVGMGGALGLAGCMGDDDSEGEESEGGGGFEGDMALEIDYDGVTTGDIDPEELEYVDQAFHMPVCRALEEVHWYHLKESGFRDWELFTYEHGAWGAWNHTDYKGQGELNLLQYEDVEHVDDRIEITVREDAYWSDGEPVVGRDAALGPIEDRLRAGMRHFDDVEGGRAIDPYEAITDYEFDGKNATLYSDGGHFGDFPDQDVWHAFFVSGGPRVPTHVQPFKDYSEWVFEEMDRAVAGEADPWDLDSDDPARDDLRDDLDDEYWTEYFREPENVVVNGAWTLEEIRGDQDLYLEPNEHHRHADSINFDRIHIESQCEPDVIWTNLDMGRYDFAEATPPQYVAEAFSDQYTRHHVPDNNGLSIVLNFKDEVLENVRVRQAINAALDKADICEAIAPDTHEPVNTPGGDNYGRPAFLDDEWFEENLQSYEYDPEFAAELMEMGGYHRDADGTWVDDDDESAELTLYTSATSPELEPLIAQQLQEFGFDAEYQTMEGAIMADAQDAGELGMWPGNQNAGTAYTMVTGWTYVTYRDIHMRRNDWFEGDVEDNIEATEWDDEGFIADESPSALEHLTIRAPPVGEFDGDLQEYDVVAMSARFQNGDEETVEELWPKLLWLGNWYLPSIPIANLYKQFFVNTENWIWPLDHRVMDYAGTSTHLSHQDLLARGDMIFANPDSPKD